MRICTFVHSIITCGSENVRRYQFFWLYYCNVSFWIGNMYSRLVAGSMVLRSIDWQCAKYDKIIIINDIVHNDFEINTTVFCNANAETKSDQRLIIEQYLKLTGLIKAFNFSSICVRLFPNSPAYLATIRRIQNSNNKLLLLFSIWKRNKNPSAQITNRKIVRMWILSCDKWAFDCIHTHKKRKIIRLIDVVISSHVFRLLTVFFFNLGRAGRVHSLAHVNAYIFNIFR